MLRNNRLYLLVFAGFTMLLFGSVSFGFGLQLRG